MEATTTESTAETTRKNTASSPDAVRLSLAAAMTLGLKPGRFYRDARLRCINLLQTYPEGCSARCAYCGLARGRAPASKNDERGRSFIRVSWPTHELDEVIERMVERRHAFGRVCLSMVTHRRAAADIVTMAQRIRARSDVPISGLLTPTLVATPELTAIREAGVDRIGFAVDAATPELFDELRGQKARGPHRWSRYWEAFREGVDVFGDFMVGCHLIVGLGETEHQMIETLQRVHDLKCLTHLFSFFPEAGSRLENHEPPSMGHYRRIQLARYLIDEGRARLDDMRFDDSERLIGVELDQDELDGIIASGEPFRTSGCPDATGAVACNRPFANCRPGPDIRNYPFALEPEDVEKVREELWR